MKNKKKMDFLLRSMLFVPGHIEKYFKHAIISNADSIVLDMEDSVPINHKEHARKSVKNKLADLKISQPIFVRVNALESGLLESGLEEPWLA